MAEGANSHRSHKRRWIGAVVGVVLLAAFVGTAWYLRSASFQDLVRRKLVAALEDATGGRVDMASFRWNLSQLAFQADDLTIHGLEPPGQLPYAHVDRALVRLRILSFFEKRFVVERLELVHPVVHLIVNPDGTTNAPPPKLKPANGNTAVQELFDLQVGHADLRDGMLVINERKLPLDFAASDVVAQLAYDASQRAHRYEGSVKVGKFDLQYGDFQDIPAAADLHFALRENALEVRDLKFISRNSTIQGSGKLTNFSDPQAQLTYTATLDVAQLGAVTRSSELRGGTLELNGTADFGQAIGYAADGHMGLRNLDYLEYGLALHRANIDANFALTQDRLALNRIAAHVFGGLVTGDADISNLVPSPQEQSVAPTIQDRTKRSTSGRASSGEQQGLARLQARGLSLNELLRTVSSRSLPLEKLNAVGSVAGSVNLEWRQSLANAVAGLALDIAAPAQPAANELPVNGSVRGRAALRSERIDLMALSLTTPHTQVTASGSLGSTSAMLQLKAHSNSLAELQPLLSQGTSTLPVELDGEAGFDGTLRGRLRSPQIDGHVEAANFTYLYTPVAEAPPQLAPAKRTVSRSTPPSAPQSTTPARRIHIDAFSGTVQYSSASLALHKTVVQQGDSSLAIDGSTTLDEGAFTDNSQFQLQATLRNGDATALQHDLGLDYPLQGRLSFAIHAAGTPADPHGQGHFSLTNGELHGRPIQTLTSEISFAEHTAHFRDIHLQAGNGAIAGSAAYDFRTREGEVDLRGHSVDLGYIPELQSDRLQVAGVADFTIKGSGTLEHPLVNAHVDIARLALNDEPIGAVTADAVTQGRRLTLTARSNFPKASFNLDGQAELEGEMPAHAELRFANLDANPFLPPRVRTLITREASLDGHAQIDGPLKQPHRLLGTLDIQQFSAEVQHVPVRSDGPVQLTFADETVSIQRCVLVGEDTHFALSGTASLHGDRALNLHALGALNLKLAQTLDPDVTSYGTANIDLTVAGTAARPDLSGRAEIVHAGLSVIDLPAGLGDLNGTLVFNQDRLELENVAGRMGGGRVKLAGFVTFGQTPGFNLSSEGTDIRFRYSGLSVTSDQSLRLTGTLQNASLTGNVTVTRFAQIPSADLQYLVAQASAPPSVPNPKSPLNNLHLEVRILSTPELTVETSLAKLSGDVDLRLRGTAARPVLLGRINIAEGDIKLAGTKYHLDRGDLTFVNPVRIDPVFDVEATTRVRDYDITIGLHGTIERLNTTYRSDPPLSTDNIVSLLAFGKTQTEQALGGTPSPGFTESASGALLTSALNQAVGSRVSRLFGSSTIRINPSLGGPENDPNARLTLEQQVSKNVTFIYITNLARSAQEVIQFEYNINADYTLEGIRDENGVVSFDLLIRKRRR